MGVLGFAEFGHKDGYPLLHFHGYPSCRFGGLDLEPFHRRKSRHLRVFALDRPGIGLSTFQPNRRIMDWPADVREFARCMGLSRFAILGVSGGGPYALACARALPWKMLSAVGLLCSVGPWQAGASDHFFIKKVLKILSDNFPAGLSDLLTVYMELFERRLPKVMMKVATELKKREKHVGNLRLRRTEMLPEETKAALQELMRLERYLESFAQGPTGLVREIQLLMESWDFKVKSVAYNPIKIWHGTEDRHAPISMIRYVAERLPHAQFHEFEGEDHFSMAKHLEKILEELIPDNAV